MQKLVTILILLPFGSALAQVAPKAGYVFPPAVSIGSEAEVRFGGYDLTPDTQLFVHHPQIAHKLTGEPGPFLVPEPPYWFGEKARGTAFPIPRELPARLKIPKGVAPGLVRWQLANANGSSATSVLYVSDEPEILEQRDRDQPQSLETLPVAVSGRLSTIAQVDRYELTATQSGPVTVELFARRLGVNMNGQLKVHNAKGRLLNNVADTEGLDATVTFFAKAQETYTVSLHDVDFRGNEGFIYRLAFTPGPRVVATLPAALNRGETREVTFIGYGLKSGKNQLETLQQSVTVPNLPETQLMWRYRLPTKHGTTPVVDLLLSDVAEHIQQPQTESPVYRESCAISGVLRNSTTQTFQWEAKQGENWRVEGQSYLIGGRRDLSLQVKDANGKSLGSSDDLKGTFDAGLDLKIPADGVYTCEIEDLSGGKQDAASVYRVLLQRRPPGFALTIPAQLNIPIGGKGTLQVTARLDSGFNDEIVLRIDNLPAGITVPEKLTIAAGKTKASVPFTLATNIAATATTLRVQGSSEVDGQSVTVVATTSLQTNLTPAHPLQTRFSALILTTTLKPKFSVELIDKNRQRAVHRGTTYPAPFLIKREEGFGGEVILQMASQQGRHRQGITAPILTVPADATETRYPCFMPEWLETDRTTRMVVMGMAKQKDPAGNWRYVTKNADARITMILEGALLKVSHQASELRVRPGEEFVIPVKLFRSPKLQTTVELELVVPDELAEIVRVESVKLPKTTATGVITVTTNAAVRLPGRWTFLLQARTLQDEKWPVISQTEVTVDFDQTTPATE